MKKFIIATALILSAGITTAQSESTPEATLQKVFDVAVSLEFTELARICDPMGEGDGDTQNICTIATASEDQQAEFVEYFATGKIVGEPIIDGLTAKVNFTFGPDGDREETMNMVNRRGVWYLSSF